MALTAIKNIGDLAENYEKAIEQIKELFEVKKKQDVTIAEQGDRIKDQYNLIDLKNDVHQKDMKSIHDLKKELNILKLKEKKKKRKKPK